jgi:hypothetical protein
MKFFFPMRVQMRYFVALVLPLLLLTGCGSKPSFEGKWAGEVDGPPGSSEKVSIVTEIKADGTANLIVTDKNGKELEKSPSKWKKLEDKKIELTMDKDDKQKAVGEWIDEKTVEITSPDNKKIKLTKK